MSEPSEMSGEAMEALSTTVRRLRTLLEEDFRHGLERRFRLSVPIERAELGERERALRADFEAAVEQCRGAAVEERRRAASELASNALLRLIALRQLEALGLRRPAVLSGGWTSRGYLEFRSHAPELASGDDYEGLDVLLRLIFDELALDLPGLYGEQPLDRYARLSAAALREVVSALNAPELDSAWQDDTTLGWVYQFWNDPEREAIDQRVGPRGKVRADEIASKTQLFTEQYMVRWLLENSLGRLALAVQRARRGERSSKAPEWRFFVEKAALPERGLPKRVSELRILDPACGSGHFLAGAFDLLVPLYREEARDLGRTIPEEAIAHSILRENLHGIDIDARAVRVAAAVLALKAKRLAPRAALPPMNLVATESDFRGSLIRFEDAPTPQRASPPALAPTSQQASPPALAPTSQQASPPALAPTSQRASPPALAPTSQRAVFGAGAPNTPQTNDLGIRFDATPLAAELRLRQLLVEHRYDVVVFNPPYLATAKIDLPERVLSDAYGENPDLFAAFVERALELCKPEGFIAFVALSNWMFLSSFRATRERILSGQIVLLADVGKGAFRRASKLIQSAMVIASPTRVSETPSFAARVGSRDAPVLSSQLRAIADALEDPASYTPFDPEAFREVEGAPLLFFIDPAFLRRYARLPKIGEVAQGLGGIATSNNERFLRAVWEVPSALVHAAAQGGAESPYLPYLKGAEGRAWIEPYRWVLRAAHGALELRLLGVRAERARELGVAYTTIGHHFAARLHTVPSVRDVSGASVFPSANVSRDALLCALNRTVIRELAAALNPTVNFQLGDVRRLPFDPVEEDTAIVRELRRAFEAHERGNELSVDYVEPGPSCFRAAQAWAQRAVDRAPGEPLPPAVFEPEPPPPWLQVSHALGLALGRFERRGSARLPDGILFLAPEASELAHAACAPLRAAWAEFGASVSPGEDLATYLRKSFFAEHRALYEGRPIYFPLASTKRSYLAYVCFHALSARTLNVLLAEHLLPEKRRTEGELLDLRAARANGTSRSANERRLNELQRLLEELTEFITKVSELAERGPPRSDDSTRPREVDAPYDIALEDGVLVNAAALWTLLEPSWKDPKKLWKELANADGKRDYDWSKVAARYFPTRVREKCREDPALAVAHACFQELHPAKAELWERRLKDELGPGFGLDRALSESSMTALPHSH